MSRKVRFNFLCFFLSTTVKSAFQLDKISSLMYNALITESSTATVAAVFCFVFK